MRDRAATPGSSQGAGDRLAPRAWKAAAALLIASLLLPPASLRAQIPPDAAWRTLRTEHFHVHFTPELEPLARRAAASAERAYGLLSESLVEPPGGTIDLIVADNVDFANGFATPFPRNRVVVYAHSPADTPELAFTDDWLEMVVTHELAHIFHLDYAEGPLRALRSLFGRSPLFFPHAFAPGWVAEGLATYYESRLSGAGRVRGTMHEMALRTAVLEGEFFPIDRVSGDPVAWPGPASRYVYGSMFVDYLARRYGPERVGDYVRALRVPYGIGGAARRGFGASFPAAWREWTDSLSGRYAALADSLRAAGLTEPEVLTRGGGAAEFPRFSPDGAEIAYAASTGRDEPALRVIDRAGRERVVAPLRRLGPAEWEGDGSSFLLSELEFHGPHRIFADLYRVRGSGEKEDLTEGARIWEPSLSPDGRRIVAVRSAEGTNVLVLRDLADGAERVLTERDPGVAWSLPRWSPDGERIAVGRWRRGGYFDVVLLDAEGRLEREVTSDRAMDRDPAWSPDGRHLVFSSDRTGIPNLYAFDLETGELRQVSNVLTGAFQPDVSPDGGWIAFSYYRADGYRVARIPFDPPSWRPAPPLARRFVLEEPAPAAEVGGGESLPYSPWRTLVPTSWAVAADRGTALGTALGVAVDGSDVIERHRYRLELLGYLDGGRTSGSAAYRYAGLGNPLLNLSAEQRWSVLAAEGTISAPEGGVVPTALFSRRREADLSLTWLRRRWRTTAWVGTGAEVGDTDRAWQRPEAAAEAGVRALDPPPFAGLRLDAGYSALRSYAFSIGPERGFSVVGSASGRRHLRAAEGADAPSGYVRTIGRGILFRGLPLPGYARHVLAIRASAGAELGDRSPLFSVGGASGEERSFPGGLGGTGGALAFPVRGYDEGARVGDRAFSASAEYRFPLLLVERGVGTLPVYLDRLWGDLFADAGGAWCADTCPRTPGGADLLYSVGAEAVTQVRVGYFVDLTLRAGVAFPLTDVGAGSLAPRGYLRFGRSF